MEKYIYVHIYRANDGLDVVGCYREFYNQHSSNSVMDGRITYLRERSGHSSSFFIQILKSIHRTFTCPILNDNVI